MNWASLIPSECKNFFKYISSEVFKKRGAVSETKVGFADKAIGGDSERIGEAPFPHPNTLLLKFLL